MLPSATGEDEFDEYFKGMFPWKFSYPPSERFLCRRGLPALEVCYEFPIISHRKGKNQLQSASQQGDKRTRLERTTFSTYDEIHTTQISWNKTVTLVRVASITCWSLRTLITANSKYPSHADAKRDTEARTTEAILALGEANMGGACSPSIAR